jgi:hypothetical protein
VPVLAILIFLSFIFTGDEILAREEAGAAAAATATNQPL